MSQYKEVEEQVKSALETGMAESEIKAKLVEVGYNDNDIFQIVRDAKLSMPQKEVETKVSLDENVKNTTETASETKPKPESIIDVETKVEERAEAETKPEAESKPEAVIETVPEPSLEAKAETNRQSNMDESAKVISEALKHSKDRITPVQSPELKQSENVETKNNNSNVQGDNTVIHENNPQVESGQTIIHEDAPATLQNKSPKSHGSISLVTKILAIVVFIFLISTASVFAYYKVDPFFLKDPKVVFSNAFVETYRSLLVKDFSGTINYDIDYTDTSVDGLETKMKINIPAYFAFDYLDGVKSPNASFKIGDIDLEPILSSYALLLGTTEELGEAKINFEVQNSKEKVFFKINKLPEIAKQFLPSIDNYLNTWIYTVIEEIEKVASVDADEAILTPEEMEFAIERIKSAIVYEAEPEITEDTVDGKMVVMYRADSKKLAKALFVAADEITQKLEDTESGEAELTITNYEEDLEKLNGYFEMKITINKDLLIEKTESFLDNTYDKSKLQMSIITTLDFETPVTITEPVDARNAEDIIAEITADSELYYNSIENENPSLYEDYEETGVFEDDFGNSSSTIGQ